MTNFPTSLQDLDATRGSSSQALNNPSHATHHALEDDTIEAIQTKLGVDNSAVTSSIDYLLKSTSSVSPGHKHVSAEITDLAPISSSTGVADAGKLVKTNGSGVFDSSLFELNFGDGSDGDVTISAGTTVLTRDMYYNNLVITGTLSTDGFKVYVKGTVSGDGILQGVTGNNGSVGTSNTRGGAGGAGGAQSGTGIFKTTAGTAGGAAGNSSVGVAGSNGTAGNFYAAGKNGGAGGNGAGNAGGAGGTGGVYSGDGRIQSSLWNRGVLVTSAGAIAVISQPGSAGGGGGGSVGADAPGAGGGGGATGGIVFLCANAWTGAFTIKSLGGNGGNGGTANSGNSGSGGGGGGGNGGSAIIFYKTKTWSGSYLLTGGSAGAAGGGSYNDQGDNGVAGADGTSYEIPASSAI